ncbi:MAG: exodeoxyribonuclease VII small subunit [Duncaniella sp.]|nr:exodeoxyribonuclease VII small subunit [Duncaniella sp.]
MSEPSFNDNLRELEDILRKMQSEQCDIDKLAEYTRRATSLLCACRERLTATEQELATILETLKV